MFLRPHTAQQAAEILLQEYGIVPNPRLTDIWRSFSFIATSTLPNDWQSFISGLPSPTQVYINVTANGDGASATGSASHTVGTTPQTGSTAAATTAATAAAMSPTSASTSPTTSVKSDGSRLRSSVAVVDVSPGDPVDRKR